MVEVFKTNVQEKNRSIDILYRFNQVFPGCNVNFDLEDCDKILRVEAEQIPIDKVIRFAEDEGFVCKRL